jgi:hypothetical protein
VGVQKDQYTKAVNDTGVDGELATTLIKPEKVNNPYGFDSLRKEFEEGVSEVARAQALKNVGIWLI